MWKYSVLSITALLLLFCINSINSQPCFTSTGTIGNCVLLKNCNVLLGIILQSGGTLTKDQRILLSESWCGIENNQHKVCCPQTPKEQIPEPEVPTPDLISLIPTDYSQHKNAKYFDFRQCGTGPMIDKIAGGDLTNPFDYPWMAILQYKNLDVIEQNCGGTLITNRFVLSAAHCITMLYGGIELHSVVLGEHNTKTTLDCHLDGECAPPVQIILIDQKFPHPLYNKQQFIHDIGLIRLQELATRSFSVIPVCLPVTLATQIEQLPHVRIVGWGKTEYSKKSDVMLTANITTTSNSECAVKYRQRYRERYNITDIHMCAGGNASNSCQGDSGGPATHVFSSDFGPRNIQYGVVSGGVSECSVNNDIPDLYARVVPYMKWILDICNE